MKKNKIPNTFSKISQKMPGYKKPTSAFTLYELLLAMTVFFLVIAMVMKFYVYLLGLKTGLEGRQVLVEQSYHMLERLQVQIKDYKIDYEEYFNRKVVGCDTPPTSNDLSDFRRNVNEIEKNGYCDVFTAYGNQYKNTSNHTLYYCTSKTLATDPKIVLKGDNLLHGQGCITYNVTASIKGERQSFGQYHEHFKNVNQDADTIVGAVGDDDDEDLGIGPEAIGHATGVQELYLISKDNQKRLFFRRALVETGNYDGSGQTLLDSEKLQTIQFLKLQGLDVGNDHTVANDAIAQNRVGLYDGQIDTRACDYQAGFLCNGMSVGGLYSGYNLPQNVNDGWTRMFSNNITLPERNIAIYPTKNPLYAWGENDVQVNPYILISFQAKLYGPYWSKKLPNVEAYTFSVQTTFNTHTFYGQ